MDWITLKEHALKLLLEYGPKIILAIVLLIVGLFLIKKVKKVLGKILTKKEVDVTAQKFIIDLLGVALKVLLFVSVLTMFGVATTSFVAIIGAAGLAIGLALQGTLQNFAGGVLILIFKPYKVGDLVSMQGETGVVKEIQIFNTLLNTAENKRVIIPNGAIMNANITNFSSEGMMRVDMKVGIAYDSDIKLAKNAIMKVLLADDRILNEPKPIVAVGELADSAIVLEVRPYTTPADYWGVYFDTLEMVKEALDEVKISIPFPQTELTIKGNNELI